MDKRIKDYFIEANSSDEHWANAAVLTRSLHCGLTHMLNRITSYHELLELELESNPAGKIYIKESEFAVRKSRGLLDALRSFSTLRSGAFDSVDLKVLVTAIVNRLNKYDNLTVDADFSRLTDDESFISGDLFLLQQLFFDLPHLFYDEAANRTDLAITGEVRRFEQDFFSARKSPLPACDYMSLTVTTDDAATIRLDNFVNPFEWHVAFPDADIPERLYFIHGAVNAHGGEIFFTRGERIARALLIVLPIQKNQIAMYTDAGIEQTDLQGNETILLVDDEDIIWDVVIDMLQNMGYSVILAANGRDCVDIYRDNPGQIDLVLLDMVMPEMNGHEAFFQLKAIDDDVKVLLSSGYVEEKDARDVLSAGAAGFLQKPYRMVELARRIRQIIDN